MQILKNPNNLKYADFSELLGVWTSFIIWYSKIHRKNNSILETGSVTILR
jgi:hypothetical protein